MRLMYREHYVSDVTTKDGAAKVIVRPIGRNVVEWSQVGSGDHQLGFDYVDEKLDGKKQTDDRALQSVLLRYGEVLAENDQLKEEIATLKAAESRVNVERERWMGMLMLSGELNDGVIKAAYKKQAKRWHPDQGGDAEVFRLLQVAKEQLLKLC